MDCPKCGSSNTKEVDHEEARVSTVNFPIHKYWVARMKQEEHASDHASKTNSLADARAP